MQSQKKPCHLLLACLSLLIFGATPQASLAQTNTNLVASAPLPSAGLLNDWLRQQSAAFQAWDIGGQLRFRFADETSFAVPNLHQADLEHTSHPANAYELLRERVHTGWMPCPWFEVYGEMQDSTALNDQRNPSPSTDHFMLRQAWASVGDLEEFPLVAKAGRQELIYGDQRIIGVFDWLNVGRTFDAAKMRYQCSNVWVDAFISQPVLPDLHGFDTSDSHDKFSGLYASTRTLIPIQETQFYFLARNTDPHPAYEAAEKPVQYPLASPRDIYTVGGRVQSLAGTLDGWDYGVEGGYQFGRFEFSNNAPNLSQSAYAIHLQAGHTWTETPLTPRLGVEYNDASGGISGGKHGTFDNLFPSPHGLYGIMDFFSWQNMRDVRLATSVKPLKQLTLRLDGYCFWLDNTDDYFYQGNGAPRTTGGYGLHPGYSSFVGSEVDFIASWALSAFASLEAGYGHFFDGDYIKESLAGHGGSTGANFFYTQLIFNF